jgi:hypothetical protein
MNYFHISYLITVILFSGDSVDASVDCHVCGNCSCAFYEVALFVEHKKRCRTHKAIQVAPVFGSTCIFQISESPGRFATPCYPFFSQFFARRVAFTEGKKTAGGEGRFVPAGKDKKVPASYSSCGANVAQ